MTESPVDKSSLDKSLLREEPSQRKTSKKARFAFIGTLLVAALVGVTFVFVYHARQGENEHSRLSSHSKDGVLVKIGNDLTVELATQGNATFRVSVAFGSMNPTQISNPMLDPSVENAPYTVVRQGSLVGIRSSFGQVTIDSVNGGYQLTDAAGNIISASDKLASIDSLPSNSGDTCSAVFPGYDVNIPNRTPGCPNGLSGQTQDTCCKACNNDPDCTVWVFATPGHESEGKNCWLIRGADAAVHRVADGSRIVGGGIARPPSHITLSLGKSTQAKFYGTGSGASNSRTLSKTSGDSKVTNTEFYSPRFYSSDGYGALAVSPYSYNPDTLFAYPATWESTSTADRVKFTVLGTHADLYLTPAASQAEAIDKYWDLTGRPVLLPRYAFGFAACRWGWTDHAYVTDMLSQFRSGKFPIDSWISDFEWYTPEPDYSLPESGSPTFDDFGYNAKVFPDPVNNLKEFHESFNLRFGGIRKPRLGNSDLLVMAKQKGWTVNADHSGGAPGGTRNLNYSIVELQDWYAENTAHFLPDGVDYYWNDEGETYYFAFHDWNVAQIKAQVKFDPKKRFYTINRSFTPGLQRLGATQWTGDIAVSWDSLQNQPGYMLNWALAGTPYVTMDTGGFNGGDDTPQLLARWYQVAVFTPIMRVHSSLNNKPHFPFLYGDEAADAMRKAMNLRYQLIPFLYSLGHLAFRQGGVPIFRPLAMEFPEDPRVAETTSEWMAGDSILPCPVMREDNTVQCYLPAGEKWFDFGTSTIHNGGSDLSYNNIALDYFPIFVKSGSIVPLAPVVQHTDALPGGPLQVNVYTGKDASFLLVEDDGETNAYQLGDVRETSFTWKEDVRTMYWSVSGSYAGPQTFTQAQFTVHFVDGSQKQSNVYDLNEGGAISF